MGKVKELHAEQLGGQTEQSMDEALRKRKEEALPLFNQMRGAIMVDDELLQRLMLHAGRLADRVRGGYSLAEAVRGLAEEFDETFSGQLDVIQDIDAQRLELAWRILAEWSLEIELEEGSGPE